MYLYDNQQVSTYLPHQGKYRIIYNKNGCYIKDFFMSELIFL
ncbi:hypothetical protein KKH3_06900 [Pectobacterium actinidiae]|nr:hypothetical protein KKH3_06900 [Pectobacterium actinidiae]